MLEGPLLPSIISYTIPIILTSVLQLLFNAADLVIVGQFKGSICVGAVGATGSITNLIVNLFIGLSVGTGVTVAHGIGAQEHSVVHKTVHTAIPTALVSGVVLTVVGVTFAESFLRWMDTPADVLPLSALYMKIYFCGITFTMIYNFCASILRAAGDTKSPLIFLAISGVLNVALNVVFVTVFDMDVDGVALATILSQALSAALVVIALMRRTDACKLELRKIKFYGQQLGKILRIGLPAGIQGSLFSISNVLIQSSINSFGEVFVAGSAAAGNIEGFVYVSMNAFSQTAVNYVGQNAGARQYDRVRKTLWICIGCALAVGVFMAAGIYAAGPQLLSIYINDSAQAIADGMLRLTWVLLPYGICGIMDATTGALRGLGASVAPMVISVLGVCVLRIGWIMTLFRAHHTPEVLFVSYPISWAVTFAAQLLAFLFVYKKQAAKRLS